MSAAPPARPRFSIVLPVLNEAATLPTLLDALARDFLTGGHAELIVVDGGSTDGTRAIAEPFGRVVEAPRGRARQMNVGAAQARGDILIFLHADTSLPRDAFAVLNAAFRNPSVVGGAFRVQFDTDALAYRLVAASITWRGIARRVFTGDQAYAIRRSAFESVGGFPDQPLMEDLEIVRSLRRVGRFVLLPGTVTTSARRHRQMGLGKTLLLMGAIRTLYAAGMPPDRLHRLYLDIR